mmetsp:Transcript_25444/g.38666  ORF Transcript_25444/g.38666 Transcript_25444/m.38666 type:complete len:96 (+) Transcript_25444:146-433(+)
MRNWNYRSNDCITGKKCSKQHRFTFAKLRCWPNSRPMYVEEEQVRLHPTEPSGLLVQEVLRQLDTGRKASEALREVPPAAAAAAAAAQAWQELLK